MKKIYSMCGVVTLALALISPALSQAQTMMDVEGSSAVNASMNGGPGAPVPGSIRERIRADIQGRMHNADDNQNYRNQIIQQRFGSSSARFMGSTSRRMMFRHNDHQDREGSTTLMGSTTFMGRFHGEEGYENEGRGMREDAFRNREGTIIRQLALALNNLRNVRTRIASRITKAEGSGRDMTTAIKLLGIADLKISAADAAIKALANTSVTASSTNASTTAGVTAVVDLGKPRARAAGAIQAIMDARRALNDVVVAIAHSMGYRFGDDGSIVPPSPTPITPSPTPSVTPSVSATPTGSATPSPSATPSTSPSPSVSSSPSPTASASPSSSATPSATPTATATASATPTPTH